jgi:MFS family permease
MSPSGQRLPHRPSAPDSSTADRLGRARVLKLGLALFTAASLACSLAPGIDWLIAFRVLQGVGGSMLNPVAMSIIRNTFEDPRERAQAIGIWGAVVGISMAAEPLVELRFFASRPFSAATAIAVAAFTAFGGFLFVNTLYLQDVRGLSPALAGLCTLPMAIMTVLFSPISGRVVGARGVRGPLVVGGLGLGIGSLMLVSLSARTSLIWLLGAYCVFGLGFGAVNPPITNAAVSGMPASQAGVAAAVATTSRQIGQTLGVAVVGAIATAGIAGSLHRHLAAASRPGWWLIAAVGAAIVALGLAASTAAAEASAGRTAARLRDTPRKT